ncbi:MAG: hypothetical protein ACKVOL_04355, partial [Novosphingobium sp.]
MTAPAAALIQRPLPKRDAVREPAHPAREARAPAQDRHETQGFAAHLERSSPPRVAGRPRSAPASANETRVAKPEAAPLAKPDAAPSAEPATEAAAGRTLPDTRQAPARPATQSVLGMLNARAATDGETTSVDTAKPDAETETAETAASAIPVLPSKVPAFPSTPAIPSPAMPPRAAATIQAEPATEAATGRTLPDSRQAPARPATQSVLGLLNARAATEGDDPSVDTAKSDAETETTETAGSAIPVLPPMVPALLTAPAVPSPAMPPRAAATTQTGLSADRGTAPLIAPGRPTAAPSTGTADPAAANPGTAAPAALAGMAAPALSFILERDGTVSGSPDPAAADAAPDTAQPGTDKTAAKVQPSTLARLTGAAMPGRPALRKARAEVETTLPDLKSPAAEITASAFALVQPATGSASAVSASAGPASAAQPAVGIGLDALVDSIDRARDGAADGAPVAVAMRHAEFGRISMRFHSDADGMSVAMTSPDPAFAPAVAAAHAAEAAANTEPAPRASQTGTASVDLAGSQTQGGARS